MEARIEEVIGVLRKWKEEHTLLECRIAIPSRAFWGRLRGRICSLSTEEVELLDEDDTSEVRLFFRACEAFGFSDAREVSSARGSFEGTLGFILRVEDERFNDFISLSEVVV